jgi:hypothetical protein
MTAKTGRVAIVWRGDRAARRSADPRNNRYHRIFEALEALGIAAEPAVYDESFAEEAEAQLCAADGVLVWVNPLQDGKTRAALDQMLRAVAARGPWVSAHPDTILKMGVKEVLYRTRQLGWGTDTHLYRSAQEFRDGFPARLAEHGPRVIKQNRGNAGLGVWKVERVAGAAGDRVRVLHAVEPVPEELPLATFLARCEAYFGWGGCLIDQRFQPRLPEGMIRCYMGEDRVVGYGQQIVRALVPPSAQGPAQSGPRLMHGPDAAQFQALRRKMEAGWTPEMMQTLGLDRAALPVIWDADFLLGPRTAAGEDSYVLCEINVSSVFAIPDEAPAAIARIVQKRLRG